MNSESKRFDVALSFPGDHREFVSKVAEDLSADLGQQRVLYDKYHEAEFARPNLDTHLPNLYRTESELIAVFLCAEYSKKRWCNLEWRFIRQLLATAEEDRIMFLSFDEVGAIPEIGILSGDGYVAIAARPSKEIAKLILQRLTSRARQLNCGNGALRDSPKPVVITVLLPDDHDSFNADKAAALRSIIAQEVSIEPDQVAILRTRSGSTKVDIELTEEAAKTLLAKYATGQGALRDRGILKIHATMPESQSAKTVSLRRLGTATWSFVGRETELAQLDHIVEQGRIRVATLVAAGGVGKTTLVTKWLSLLAVREWLGFEAIFDWSFYSQGTREQTAPSSDLFLKEALTFFGDATMAGSPAGAFDKGRRLAQLVCRRRALLVLDGLEPLQFSPASPTAGELKDQGIAALLKGVAASHSQCLCVITTRYGIPELRSFWGRTVAELPLQHLSRESGMELLRSLEVKGSEAELAELVADMRGHALSLRLIGSYLRYAHGGDIRHRDRVKLTEADSEEQGGHASRVMDAYVKAFEGEGKKGKCALALMRLLGLFDRPADAQCIAAVLKKPVIPGLTEPLAGSSEKQRHPIIQRLEDAKLISSHQDGAGALISLDAHPILREYFARRLCEEQPDAWRTAHRRIYEHQVSSTHHREEPTLEDLQPLYQAVTHGCHAGLWQEVLDKVYFARIHRFDSAYSIRKLGAFASDLGAIACFFDTPWSRIPDAISEGDRAWLLNSAAYYLRALGRLAEALEPLRFSLESCVRREDWRNSAQIVSNLADLELTLGEMPGAVLDAKQSMIYADRSGEAFVRTILRTMCGDALHQAGHPIEAETRFREAEQMQQASQPDYPLLYSLGGFRYCDLLLAIPERAAWRTKMGVGDLNLQDRTELIAACREVSQRAAQTLEWVESRQKDILSASLDHLTLGRASLYEAILANAEGGTWKVKLENAKFELDAALSGLRRAGTQDHLPRSLLTRAWLRFLDGKRTGPISAQEDLDEAWEISERGPMRLHMADIHLYRARLFGSPKQTPLISALSRVERGDDQYPWDSPKADLAAAKKLINQCGYHRRDEELGDANGAILS